MLLRHRPCERILLAMPLGAATRTDLHTRRTDLHTCAQCERAFEGSRWATLCRACRAERVREGVARYWSEQRQQRPLRACGKAGCEEPIPSWRKYCSKTHYGAAITGPRPDLRHGGKDASCQHCGRLIGYRPRSWWRKNKGHHYCSRECQAAGHRSRLIGRQRCFRCRSWIRPGSQLCRSCYLLLERRGRITSTHAETAIREAMEQFRTMGRSPTVAELAQRAGVTRKTVYNVRARERAEAKERHEPSEYNYKLHLRRKEMPCRACRDAARKRMLERRNAKAAGMARTRRPLQHGTVNGYNRHRYYGEEPCDACRRASAEDRRTRRWTQHPETQPYVRPPCGTEPGYRAHRYRQERPCKSCREAHTRHYREYRRAKAREGGK